jgi:hypothetical protein
MSALRAFFRPEASQPAAIPTTHGDEGRECYTPADVWLRRLARKAKKPMLNSSIERDAAPDVRTDVVLQPDGPPILSLVPLPVERGIDETKFVYEASTSRASLISVNDTEKYHIRNLDEFMGDITLQLRFVRLDLQKHGTPQWYITLRPHIAALLKEIRAFEKTLNGPREAKPHPDQLSLLETIK